MVDCRVVWLLQPHLRSVGSSLCPKDLNASKLKGTSPLTTENTQARQAHRVVWIVPRISLNTCPAKKVACHLRPYCFDLLLGLPSLAAMPWAGLHHCIMRTDCEGQPLPWNHIQTIFCSRRMLILMLNKPAQLIWMVFSKTGSSFACFSLL